MKAILGRRTRRQRRTDDALGDLGPRRPSTKSHGSPAGNRNRGMTLVELLVVLTILALLTAVAATSSDVLLVQGRYEATSRTLTNLQEAVLGPLNARQADGTVIVSGFLADMGRLPAAVGSDPLTGLAELWTNPGSLAAFAIRQSTFDPEVLVPTGWRGPYLRLPVGQSVLRDGWGNSLDLLDAGGSPVLPDTPIAAVRSRGADGAIGGTGYSADVTASLADGAQIAVSGNVYLLDANGQRTNPPDPAQIQVWLYGPDGANGGLLETSLPTTVDPVSGVVSYAATTTAGPRFLRAYLGTPPTRKSAIVRFRQSDVIPLDIN